VPEVRPSSEVAAPASPARPEASPAPTARAATPTKGRAPVTPSYDAERPPAEPARVDDGTGFAARLSLGIGASLWVNGHDTVLHRPLPLGLDLGYALTRKITLMARGSTWLPTGRLANEFLGAGVTYHFAAARLYVAGALGASLTRIRASGTWSHYFQGLALEADVGQVFPLSTSAALSFGAHFQLGTPLLGKAPDAFTSVLAGIFVAVGLR
jgi:hypothetical protein